MSEPALQPFVHVVARSASTPPFFLRTSDYRAHLTALCRGLERHPTRLLAYAMLPSHWELVVGPSDSHRTRQLALWVTATHARRLESLHRIAAGARAYREPAMIRELRSPHELVHVCRAVERRAVEALLVTRAQDWPWSSLADRFRLLRRLPLTSPPILGSDWWVSYVNYPEPRGRGAATVRSLRQAAKPAPRPSGETR